jgi:hypothetical protein
MRACPQDPDHEDFLVDNCGFRWVFVRGGDGGPGETRVVGNENDGERVLRTDGRDVAAPGAGAGVCGRCIGAGVFQPGPDQEGICGEHERAVRAGGMLRQEDGHAGAAGGGGLLVSGIRPAGARGGDGRAVPHVPAWNCRTEKHPGSHGLAAPQCGVGQHLRRVDFGRALFGWGGGAPEPTGRDPLADGGVRCLPRRPQKAALPGDTTSPVQIF